MKLDLDRSTWKRVRFGDVVRQVKSSVDPETSGLERYVAGDHMDTDELRISRWGTVGDGYLGPAFHRSFRAGQVLYGSRRTYLRKVAYAEFDGICSNTTFIAEAADDSSLLPGLLPFLMTTQEFHRHSVEKSKGSVNPYVNWSDLACFEFGLPGPEDQQRIVDLLWSIERHRRVEAVRTQACANASRLLFDYELKELLTSFELRSIGDLQDVDRRLTYGVVQPGTQVDAGTPLIRVCDLEFDNIDWSKVKRIDTRLHRQFRRSQTEISDVLISIVGTIGRVHVVDERSAGANIARAVARIAVGERLVPEFLAAVLRSSSYQEVLSGAAFESARKTLNLSSLAQVRVPVPPISVQAEFVGRADQFSRCGVLCGEAERALVDLRSDLLREIWG